jgi:transposase
MHLLKEVLRLTAAGLSQRQIARSLQLSHGVVGKYQAAAQRAGLSWPLPETLDDVTLANRLFTKPAESAAGNGVRAIPDFANIHEQLKEKGVTRLLLWEEYRAADPGNSYSYTQFCFHYQQWRAHLKLVMRQTHRAGEKLFVDYAGPTVPIVNPITGEIREAQIFVAVLGASNYTYAEATWTQGLADWIGAHTRAFSFFGGVPALVVPDNPRSGVTKACRYEPLLNTS